MHTLSQRCIGAVLLAALLAGCAAPASRKPTLIPEPVFDVAKPGELPRTISISLMESSGYLFTPVHINRRSAGMFMLDTGASITVVESGVAGRLGLPVVGKGQALGVGGFEAFDWRGVEGVSFGDLLMLSGDRVAALSLHDITRGLGVPVGGIVGHRSFGSVPYTIDYPARQLTLHRPDKFVPPPGAVAWPLVRGEPLPVIEATVGDPAAGRKVRLLLDTGAHHELTLPDTLQTQWRDILAVQDHGPISTRGVGGTVRGAGTWVNRLDMLGVTLRDVPTHFEPAMQGPRAGTGGGQGAVPMGRIGNPLLRYFVLTFDPRTSRVYAVFVPEGAHTQPVAPQPEPN